MATMQKEIDSLKRQVRELRQRMDDQVLDESDWEAIREYAEDKRKGRMIPWEEYLASSSRRRQGASLKRRTGSRKVASGAKLRN